MVKQKKERIYLLFSRSRKKLGFCLIEKAKQSVYEFYAEQSDEYNEWYQALSDAHTRLIGEPLTSLSSTSLSSSSGYETIGGLSLLSNLNNRDDLSIGSSSSTNSSFQSQPSSTTFNRKNNLQLQLSTIIDANDDPLNASFKNADKKAASPTLSTNASPTLINNLQYKQNWQFQMYTFFTSQLELTIHKQKKRHI